MKEQDFIAQHSAAWQLLDDYLEHDMNRKLMAAEFPERYRQLCAQLAFARASGYSDTLLEQLNQLAVLGRGVLYRRQKRSPVSEFVLRDLPRAVRRERRWIWAALVVFLAGIVFGVLAVWQDWDINALDSLRVQILDSYEPAASRRAFEIRTAGDDVAMWGYYINHNTSISLRTIAGGALAGVGAFYADVFNGGVIGAAAAITAEKGWIFETFLPFVVTHSAFELTGLIFAAAAGFALAAALFFPGRLTRGQSVQQFAARFLPLLICVIVFDFVAAGLEAFFSPRNIDPLYKYLAGSCTWALVISYFTFAGREGARAEP